MPDCPCRLPEYVRGVWDVKREGVRVEIVGLCRIPARRHPCHTLSYVIRLALFLVIQSLIKHCMLSVFFLPQTDPPRGITDLQTDHLFLGGFFLPQTDPQTGPVGGRRGGNPANHLIVGLLVRPVGHQAQSLVIALRPPATKRSPDLNRYSPDIH